MARIVANKRLRAAVYAALLVLPLAANAQNAGSASNGGDRTGASPPTDLQALQASIVRLQEEKKVIEARLDSVRGVLQQALSEAAAKSLALEEAQRSGSEQAQDETQHLRDDLEAQKRPRDEAGQSLAYLEQTLAVDELSTVTSELSELADGGRYAIGNDALFRPGTASLSSAGQKLLARLAQQMTAATEYLPDDLDWALRIDNHTGSAKPKKGSKFTSNWDLSAARAAAIADYVATRSIPAEHLEATGFADSRPFAQTDEDEDRAADDRTELHFVIRMQVPPSIGGAADPDQPGDTAPENPSEPGSEAPAAP